VSIPPKHRFLFVFLLILGKDTAYRNLRNAVSTIPDIDATWIPIELEPKEWIAKIPPVSLSHSLKYGMVARSRVLVMEKSGKSFDAAFFNHILPTLFLKDFRKRVPSVDAMDVTPLSLIRDGQPYYPKPRSQGGRMVAKFKRKFAQSVFFSASYLLPQSNYTRESLIHDYDLPEERIRVLTPGVNLAMWPGRSSNKVSARQSESAMNILFVGGDFWRKGGDVLLKVAERKEFQECQFHFVTRAFPGNCPANVFVHSNVDANSSMLLELYRHADVFVLPTRADFAPTNSICEAMAMGLPVVSTAVGGIDENVIDGENGFIVPVNNEESLSERLKILKNNRDLRLQFGRNARMLAQSRFDLAVNSRSIVELMKKAASEKIST
jgi:glycosyltransferase involved in cell wall biosynthesis